MILKIFLQYSNNMNNIYENIEECNPNGKRKILIVFDDMIADMHNDEKFKKIANKLLIRGKILNLFIVFITQSCFKVQKDVRLITEHFVF